MSRDEADEPVDGGEHTESGRTPDPSPHFTVVISGDGSAAIDGEPVQVAEGEAVDAAILDTLHGHARDRGITVTAAISDPAAGYVAFVEVSPDGSSSLLEQQQEPEASAPVPAPAPSLVKGDALDDADDDGPAGGTGPAVAPGVDAHEEAHDDFDEAAYALPEPEGPPPPPPSDGPRAGAGAGAGSGPEPGAGPGAGVGRGRGLGWDSGSGSASRSESATRPVPPPKPARRTASRQSDDAFEGPGLLSRPLVVGPVALGVAALVVVPLVILGSGGSDGGGNQEQAAARASSSPSAEVSPTLETPPRPTPPGPTSASPSAEPKDKDKDKDKSKAKDKNKPQPKPTYTPGAKSGGRVTVTVTATPPKDTTTVTAKPPQDTAASAVKRLAGNDPSGRHICYRAYVAGQGWQKPVCDGTIAGTSGQNRPIKALNIAVHGVDGSAANAFRHSSKPVDGRGEWEPSWTAITGDGKNFYIGSSKRNAPNMLGFAINVGSGEVCHAVRLRQGDWAQRTCSKPRPDYTFGGTLDNDVWLEAVKFTV